MGLCGEKKNASYFLQGEERRPAGDSCLTQVCYGVFVHLRKKYPEQALMSTEPLPAYFPVPKQSFGTSIKPEE
ncbi:MAG: hypothetical protein D3909_11545 [Candidatus Electrothrix sp. ATG1]|nr:hypothetical protein [Candidatus Electrothrix sp. ATG1]